ncbi:serine hydrolase domain-containing protein [Amycolatopsis anabasis]|uniref:serine hydrolase domain-containing protein n=1 Tax=Amycolatopsis anabasis TaxID=1840409 RepID=UPI00131A7D78|nr:serine hydrolase domain-containing protein [Amycolatopsis anabasis]
MRALNRRTVLGGVAAGTAAALLPVAPAAAATDPKSLVDETLRKALAKGIPGLAVGAFDGGRQYAAGAGTLSGAGSPAPDGRSVFQIGSITKTFTALALAEARRCHHLRLDDRLADRLDPRFPVPSLGSRQITLRHLATHASGLPPIPPNLLTTPGFDPLDPYAHFTEQNLIDGLRETKLRYEPGSDYTYSNLAFGLLGRVLAQPFGGDYEELVRTRITRPLGLTDTTSRLTPDQRARKATGHAADGTAVPDWRLPEFAGAGALYGTVDDLLRYLRAMLGDAPTYLRPSIRLVQRPHFEPPSQAPQRIGLGWHLAPLQATEHTMVWHNGGTGGFSSFAAISPRTRTGVAVLAAQSRPDRAVDELGGTLLEALDAGHR